MDKEYVTKDLGEATALLTSGMVMRSIQWKEAIAWFCFEDKQACEALSQKYFFQGLDLNVRQFYENLRMVKRKLYSEANKKGVNH